jgi:hypothetical protein
MNENAPNPNVPPRLTVVGATTAGQDDRPAVVPHDGDRFRELAEGFAALALSDGASAADETGAVNPPGAAPVIDLTDEAADSNRGPVHHID